MGLIEKKKIIHYDPEGDILWIRLRVGQVYDEVLLDNDVVVQYDEKGNLVGLEIWDASRKGLLEILKHKKLIKK